MKTKFKLISNATMHLYINQGFLDTCYRNKDMCVSRTKSDWHILSNYTYGTFNHVISNLAKQVCVSRSKNNKFLTSSNTR